MKIPAVYGERRLVRHSPVASSGLSADRDDRYLLEM